MSAVDSRSFWRDPDIRGVLRACITLGFAVGVVGVTFGVSAIAAGASTLQASAMSLSVFTGASQFSSVSVFASGGTALAAFGGAAVLAARNAVYGLAMAPTLTGSLRTRLVAAHLTIDESTAMSATQHDPRHARLAFWITGLSVFVFWNMVRPDNAMCDRDCIADRRDSRRSCMNGHQRWQCTSEHTLD